MFNEMPFDVLLLKIFIEGDLLVFNVILFKKLKEFLQLICHRFEDQGLDGQFAYKTNKTMHSFA